MFWDVWADVGPSVRQGAAKQCQETDLAINLGTIYTDIASEWPSTWVSMRMVYSYTTTRRLRQPLPLYIRALCVRMASTGIVNHIANIIIDRLPTNDSGTTCTPLRRFKLRVPLVFPHPATQVRATRSGVSVSMQSGNAHGPARFGVIPMRGWASCVAHALPPGGNERGDGGNA